MSPGIKITRYPYEEPYHLNLRIAASNGRLAGNLEYYCNASDLSSLGKQLAGFSGRKSDEIIYELGSEKPEDRFAFFLSLKVKALNSLGRCAVLIRLNNNQTIPEREVSEFSIPVEAADVNRLGALFLEFSRLKHRAFDWSVQGGKLITEDEETA
jgi:hypothetical protein